MPQPPSPTTTRRSRIASALLAAALALGLLLAATPARAGGVPVPVTPSGLPGDIEDLARYVPANSCDPHAKPGTTALAQLLVATYGSRAGIDRTCGTDPLPTSEHYDGRALDFFLSARDAQQRADASALLHWLFATDAAGHRDANARRLGVMYVIWNNRIWGAYRAGDGWRAYSSCASHPSRGYDTSCHRDHVHVSLTWEGAMARTSFWSGQVAAVDYGPCREAGLNWAARYSGPRATPYPSYPHVRSSARASSLRRTLVTYSGMQLQRGDTGPVVTAVQRVVGVAADGIFGSGTESAVTSWQRAHQVAASGVVDPATWHAVLAATSGAPAEVAHPELTRYRHTLLRRGAAGPAVTALKRRLGIQPTSGHYGRRAVARVIGVQRRHRLPANGIVGFRTWVALGG